MDEKAPLVFISYAHESDAFRQTVKELADYLRAQGIRTITDHPYENRAPQEGWRAWMQHCVEDADLVLVVCTPRYRASFEKRDPDLPAGFGRTWEAAVITQELYEVKLQNAKYIPVLPDGGSHDDVPKVLRDFSTDLRFPSRNENIFRAISDEIQDPNANLPAFRRRPPGLLSAEDNRLVADQRDVYGRETEIAAVLDFLNSTETATQVVAQLTGTGGIGKTEICKRSLRDWLRQNPGARAYWVGLNDGASHNECAADIARALGHDNLPAAEHLFPLLRPGLYYLDNLESLDTPEGNALLRRIGQAPGVRVLASSRARLAALGKPIEVDTLPLDAALRTFREAWTGDDELFDTPDFPVFVERDLGCHALSLVLVAALGDTRSLPRLMSDWRAKGTAIARQENDPTRRGSLAVSLHLSSDAVAARQPGALLLWAVAALFPDGLDQGVLDWLYRSVPEITGDCLDVLVRHRILRRKGEQYLLLPPVARFALDEAQREAGGFSWAGAKAAIQPLLRGMVQAADHIASTDAALAARAVLLEKFSAVHRFLLEECRQETPDAGLLAFFQNGLRNWFQFNHKLGMEILEAILPYLAVSAVTQQSYAGALQNLGDLYRRLGNEVRVRQLYNESIACYEKAQDDLGCAYVLKAFGDFESQLGNIDRSRQLYNEAIDRYEKEQDDLGRATVLHALGDLDSRLTNLNRSRQLYQEAIALFKKVQSGLGIANVLLSFGDLEKRLSNIDNAMMLFEEAIRLFKIEQDNLGLAYAIKSHGDLEKKIGNVVRSRKLYNESIALFKKAQDNLGLAYAIHELGDLERRHGDVEPARRLLNDSISLFKKVRSDLGQAHVLLSLGDLETKHGHVGLAHHLYEQALELYKKEQVDLGCANVHKSLGVLNTLIKKVARAEGHYQQAIVLYLKEQEPACLIDTYIHMARLVHQFGPQGQEQASAKVWHERALTIANQTGVAHFIEVVENAGRKLFG